MRKNIRPSFLDPRTKILIWLLANVVVFTWSPAVFQLSVMVAYLILFLVERKGTMLAGLLATISGYPGDTVLAVTAAARLFGYGLCYGDLLHSGVPLYCRRCLSDCHHQRQPVHGCFGEDGRSPEFFYYPCGDFALSACTSAGFASYLGCNESSKYPCFEEKLECIYVPMLRGQPRQQKNSASLPPLGASNSQKRCPPGGPSDFTSRMWWSHYCFWLSAWAESAARGCCHDYL